MTGEGCHIKLMLDAVRREKGKSVEIGGKIVAKVDVNPVGVGSIVLMMK